MPIRYLTKEEVLFFNKQLTALSGDPHAIINEANLEHNLTGIQYKYEKEQERTIREKIVWKAAFWLEQMAHSAHAFAEGNKRTTLTTTITFFGINGYYYTPSNLKQQTELVDFIKKVAKGEVSRSKIAQWLDERFDCVTNETLDKTLMECKRENKQFLERIKNRKKYAPKHSRYKKVDEKYELRCQLLENKSRAISAVANALNAENNTTKQ